MHAAYYRPGGVYRDLPDRMPQYQASKLKNAKAFADTSWGYVDLPHTPKFVTSDDTVAYAGISWYRKHFTVPAAYQGRKLFIEFGAAMQLADVWVNGTQKITHQGGYMSFTIDVTLTDADNVIAVAERQLQHQLPARPSGVDFSITAACTGT